MMPFGLRNTPSTLYICFFLFLLALISYIPKRHCSSHATSETELKQAKGAFIESRVEWHLGSRRSKIYRL